MIKKIGYIIFAFFFTLFRLFRVQQKKVFLVATHDDSPEGNVGIVADALKEKYPECRLIWFTRKDKITSPIKFFIVKAYHLATAGYVFLDNEFLPMAYIHFARNVKVVQLWHGTGTVKRFGQDVNTGLLKNLEYRANQRITHLIVNSEETKKEYASAFSIAEEKIFILGLPRTDLFLKPAFLEQKKEEFFREYTELQGKRCILYAPTFRDDEVENPELHLDLSKMSEELSDSDVLMIRLHPHVANRMQGEFENGKWDNIINVSSYSGVTTLLAVSDVLVTDYSSIIFEYCLMHRPMIFYAYDLEHFEKDGRSFYRDYKDFVPGTVVRNQEELLAELKMPDYAGNSSFAEENFAFLDGRATERLFELIF